MEEKLLKELGEKLSTATKGIDAILKSAEDEKRQLTDEERTALDAAEADADKLQAEITKVEADRQRKARQVDRQTFLTTPSRRITVPATPGLRDGTPEPNELNAALIRAKRDTHHLRGFENHEAAFWAGQWALSSFFGNQDARRFLSDYRPEMLGMTGTSDAAGGVLVPTEFSAAIIMLREEYGLARKKCDVAKMTTDTKQWPRWVSGVTTYWALEVPASITASTPAFNQVTLTARNLVALTKVSRNLANDAAVDIANMLADLMAYAFATAEDQALFLGTAASTYGGITGLITALTAATASTVTAATANTAFSTLDLTDFESMIGKLPVFPGIRPEWYISKAGWAASMARLQDAAGGNTVATIAGGPSDSQFLGYPVNWVQSMNSTLIAQAGTHGICYFGDLRMAVTFGDRQSIAMQVLNELYANTLEIGFQGHERVDINVHDVGDTSSAGAVIGLAMPAS